MVSDDTEAMLQCLGRLGVEIDKSDPRNVLVGVSRGTPSEGSRLFVGNAGTTARFLIAVAAMIGHKVSFDGDRHMRKRPMGPILKAIESIGARHDSPHGNMPFEITGNPGLHARWAREGHRPTVVVDASLSSQYTSALMMIAPALPCGMNIRTEMSGKIDAFGYIDITLEIMRDFGVSAKSPGPGSWDFEQQDYRAGTIEIEPDYSACTYFWAARVLGCRGLSIRGVKPGSTRQPDAGALQVIETFPDMPSVIDGSRSTIRLSGLPASRTCASRNATGSRRSRPDSTGCLMVWRWLRVTTWSSMDQRRRQRRSAPRALTRMMIIGLRWRSRWLR